MASLKMLLDELTSRCNHPVDDRRIQPPYESWLVRRSPYNDYVNDLASSDPRLRQPDSEQQHLPGISWDSRVVNSRIITFRDGERPDVSISTAMESDCLSEYLSQRDLNGEPLRRAYVFEGMNKDVATVLGNHFWMDPSFFMEYHRTAGTVSTKARCNNILATSLATQPYISLPYRDLLTLPSELIGYFGLNCPATRRVIETTRLNGEFDSVAFVRRKCLIWSNVRDDGWDCIVICDPPLSHIAIRQEGPSKGLVYEVNSKPVGGGYVDFLPTNLQSQQRQVSSRTGLAQDLCFYLENYSTLPGLTLETPDIVLLFARKIVASLWSRHLDHVHQAVLRSQVPMRRRSDFTGLDLATVEANWSSCQTLEKRLHQYCHDLEHTLAQMHVPLQRPDLAQVTSWRDVHVDFQMLHHRFENARNWVGKVNASITGLTGIAGNRQAFREQQLSLEAAIRTQNITTLGLLFVPLAYVATLFSMSGEYGPGGERFWLYFLIAFPVTMVVMVAFVAMGWVRKRNIER